MDIVRRNSWASWLTAIAMVVSATTMLSTQPAAAATPPPDPWHRLPDGPPQINGGAMATDPVRGQTILSGGRLANGANNLNTWKWDGSAWTNLGVAGLDSDHYQLTNATMAFDAATRKLVMFGGSFLQQFSHATFTWDGSSWHSENNWDGITPQPLPRALASMATDPKTGHVVMFGGFVLFDPYGAMWGGGRFQNDTWMWDGVQWNKVNTPNSPKTDAYGTGMTSNPAGNNILMFNTALGDVGRTWKFDGTTWTEIATDPSFSIPGIPGSGMKGFTMATSHGAPVVFGGAVTSQGKVNCVSGGFTVVLPTCNGTPGSVTYPGTIYTWDDATHRWNPEPKTPKRALQPRFQVGAIAATDPLNDDVLVAGALLNEKSGTYLRVAKKTGLGPTPHQVATGNDQMCLIVEGGHVKCNDSATYSSGLPHEMLTTEQGALISGITKIATGHGESCALAIASGGVWCWGSVNSSLLTDYATKVSGLGVATDIAMGGESACATAAPGLWCWGANDHGQLGNGTKLAKAVPTIVAGSSGFTKPAIGINHACALSAGYVKCWGRNNHGQLGTGSTTDSSVPVTVIGLYGATSVSVGDDFSCAVSASGAELCWGANDQGQLGLGLGHPSDSHQPLQVPGLLGVTATAAGAAHACATASGLALRCWGRNAESQLGNGSDQASWAPVTPGANTWKVASLSAAGNHTCVLSPILFCFGDLRIGTGAPRPPIITNVRPSSTALQLTVDFDLGSTLRLYPVAASVKLRGSGFTIGFGFSNVGATGSLVIDHNVYLQNSYLVSMDVSTVEGTSATTSWPVPIKITNVPGAVSGPITAVGADRSASVSWSPPTSDGGSPISKYAVTAFEGAVARTAVLSSSTSVVVPGLTNGTTYTFKVRAINAVGMGPYSIASNAIAPVGPPAPANDDFANAQVLSGPSGTVTGTNVGATMEVGEPIYPSVQNGASVWYRYVASYTGPITVDTCGSSFNTVLGVYTGTAVNAMSEVAASDDSCGQQSSVTFDATAGTTYRIGVAGFAAATGDVVVNWVNTPLPPPNDQLASAQVVAGAAGTIVGTNLGATMESGEPTTIAGLGVGASIWYSYTPAVTGTLTVDTCGTGFDTVLGAYTGSAVASLQSVGDDDNGCVASSTGASQVSVPVIAGTTYRIAVAGWDQSSASPLQGPVTLHWSVAAGPADNDNFAAAREVTGVEGFAPSNTIGATKQNGEPTPTGDPGGHSVWFSYLAPATGSFVVDTCGSGFDTVLGVYTGDTVDALDLVGENDNVLGCAGGVGSSVTFTMIYGTRYWFEVDGKGGATGPVWLYWRFNPLNDYFVVPQTITGTSGAVTGTNLAGTKTAGEPTPTGAVGGHSVWYAYTPTSSGSTTIDTCLSAFDTLLGVYTGSNLALLDPVVQDDDGCGPGSTVTFDAAAGTQYWIEVDGKAGAAGEIALHWGQHPANDNFAASQPIAGSTGSLVGTNVEATADPGSPATLAGWPTPPSSVWYSYSATTTGYLTVDTCGSAFDTMLAAYTGAAINALTLQAENDDATNCPSTSSMIGFAVTAGTTYPIIVDGLAGATGSIALAWKLAVKPGAPVIGTAVRGNASVSVGFTAPASNGGGVITGYTASCTSSNGGVSGTKSGPTKPIVVTGLTNGKRYTCKVAATNAAGTGAQSSASNAVTPATVPAAPAIPTATAGSTVVTLKWVAPASNGSPITGYVVTPFVGTVAQPPRVFNSPALSHSITGLVNGKAYRFKVAAKNAVGSGAASAKTPAVTVGAPRAPGGVIATPLSTSTTTGSLSVRFVAPANNGSAITKYTATCSSTNGGVLRSAVGTSSPLAVGSLTTAKTYTCAVKAINARGTGLPSVASAPVVVGAPAAPTALMVTRPAPGRLRLSFTAAAANGSTITSFTVTCTSKNGGTTRAASRTGSPITVTGLTVGTTYTCRATATNARGKSPTSLASAAMKA